MNRQDHVFVAGSDTLIGQALYRQLEARGYAAIHGTRAGEPDLTDKNAVEALFEKIKPDFVFLVAGMSGGVSANIKYPADLMLDNLLIECQVMRSAHRYGTRKLMYFASSCSYPRSCPQPMRVESLMSGPLEPTNEAFATAKIAGIKLCQAYRAQYGTNMITVIPANVFGPGDDFSTEDSHVIAALMTKMHRAKASGTDAVEVWGSGSPRREFIFADDVADAAIFLMSEYSSEMPINVGNGSEVSIREIAEAIQQIVGYQGSLKFNASLPDGMPMKMLDSTPLNAMGWQPKFSLRAGLEATYRWFIEADGRCDS